MRNQVDLPGLDLSSEADNPVVDPQYSAPQGEPCRACGCPVEPGDRFCPACGTPQDEGAAADASGGEAAEPVQSHFRCEGCGAEVATDPGQRSYVCPFCDSTYVVEFSPDLTGRQCPEFVIGFAVSPEQAQQKFAQWLRDNGWFRPSDLSQAKVADKMKGVYLPFWAFSMLAESDWSATIGQHWYRTETYTPRDSKGNTVTRTRQVQETEWWPLSGRHHHYHSGYLVSGSRGLPQKEAERIKPYQLPALKRYKPYFLAGWLSEEYSIQRDSALDICQREFDRREQSNIATFMPGDTHRDLQVRTRYSKVNSDLCLLPVYVLSYRYRNKLYRFLVNGQTGKCAGDKPVSGAKIALAVGGGLLLVLILVLLFLLLAGI
jgi:DNA-directed RNA polymerase subunit RPC12/RpoP